MIIHLVFDPFDPPLVRKTRNYTLKVDFDKWYNFSSLENSVNERLSSGLGLECSCDNIRTLSAKVDQLRSAVLTKVESLKIVAGFQPICEKQSPYDDSVKNNDIKDGAEELDEYEAIEKRLGQVSSVVEMLDALKDFRALPARVAQVAREIFDGKQIPFDSKEPVTVDKNSMVGKGGQAIVYKGSLLGKECAVKQFEFLDSDDRVSDDRSKFDKEYDTMASLDHPRIMSVLAAAEDALYLPLARGPLKDAWGAWDPKDKLNLSLNAIQLRTFLTQIAEGASYLHQKGFVHRDLKPDNCLITHDGNIVVGDLGLVDTVERIINEPMQQSMEGSRLYMAVETCDTSLADRENCTKRDVWSLGIMIWRLLSKANQNHPCLLEPNGKPIAVFIAMLGKMGSGGFAVGELESQLDPEKVAYYDPEGYIVELMKACLRFHPRERISMADIQSVLEMASHSPKEAKEKLSKILEAV